MEAFTVPFQLASDFINSTNRAVFLTGNAGTGKTTFLRKIKQQTQKQTAVVAPTGVAAINAGGSTIHSFFQLPFNPYLPIKKPGHVTSAVSGKNELISRIKLTSKRRRILQELELLIIDEISMVRCDTLDAIDVILRHFRFRPNEPFGGVQLLIIGDMFQLSPVAIEHEWCELSQFYQSPYFFHSRVMMQQPPIYIELDKIYRQKNDDFISVLNGVRNNNLSPKGYQLLQKRFNPHFIPGKEENYITLSTHNYIADQINVRELATVPGQIETFQATVKGEYPEKSYPLDIELKLKVGAKVMFIKNDLEMEKRYYNGKIGTIISMGKENILVQCANEPEPIMVNQYIWENVRYEIDASTQMLVEKVIGTFQQFPLRLAWAITIHKSQGLTFEKAIIDAGKAFVPGQVYVALSRCTSLEGLVLVSPIQPGSLSNDQHIVQHSRSKPAVEEVEKFLRKEKAQFEQLLLNQLFDFSTFLQLIEKLSQFVQANAESFNPHTGSFLMEIANLLNELQATAGKFQTQLQRLHSETNLVNEDLQKRISAGSGYFISQIQNLITLINKCPAETDSKILAQSFTDSINDILIAFVQKSHLMSSIQTSFSVEQYYRGRRSFIVPPLRINVYSGNKNSAAHLNECAHPLLLRLLRTLRNELCAAKDIPVYLVAGSSTLEELANYLPLTLNDLGQISGFGKAKIDIYGQRFLDVISDYCNKHNLTTLIDSKPSKGKKKKTDSRPKTVKVDTKLVSFQQYRSGQTIHEIANARGLTNGTIEGHLAHYVISGDIQLSELVKPEKIDLIKTALSKSADQDLNSLKHTLGESVSYGELRLVSSFFKERQ